MTLSNRSMTRRSMLCRSAQAAAFAATASSLAPLLAAPQSRGFKIGACDWSIGKRNNPAALDVAKTIGLDGVQVDLGSLGSKGYLCRPEVQAAYREAMKRTGLELASVAMCDLNSIPLKSDPRAARMLVDAIDACKSLGLTVVMPAAFGRGDLDMSRTAEIDYLVGVLKQAAPKAEKLGIVLGLEDYLSAEDNMKIIDRVGSSAMKVYYDVGNSTDKGRDVNKEIRTLGKLICEFHAKDAGHMLGQGRIDFKQVRKAMDDIDYRGWIQIEAANPHGLVPDYTAHCKFLRSVFPPRV